VGSLGTSHDTGGGGPSKLGIYVEDALILLCLVPLFIRGVFFRDETWTRVGLWIVLAIMLVVFVIRFRRVHRAFTGRDEDQ